MQVTGARGGEETEGEEGEDGGKGGRRERESEGRVRQTAAFLIRVTFGNESQGLTKLIYGRCYNGAKHAHIVSAQMVRLS